MKKIFPLTIIAIGIVVITSCNKDYTCTCTVTSKGDTHVISSDLGKTAKSNAQNKCNAIQTEYADSVNAVSAVCHI